MNNEEKKKRAAKTTRRQYELYLEELRANKAFRENKFDATQPNIIEESWENLSHKLNASGGPVKSVQEWKRVFTYWKSQVKSKARELKVAQQETGNKENKLKSLSDLENTLLDITGRVVVDGMTGVAQLGIADNKGTQTIHNTYVQNEKSMESKSIINLKLDRQNDPPVALATTSNHPNNLNIIEIINDDDIIADKPLQKKFKVDNNEIVQTEFSKKKPKSLTGCLRELVDNNAKETQQFQVLCEIRDHLKNMEKHEARRLKLEQLKLHIKYPDHIFVLSSDSE